MNDKFRDDLAIARVNKATDNTKVSPTDVLKTLLHDIESGEIKCDTLLVMTINRNPDEAWGVNYYRCNVSRPDEVGLLELAKHTALRRWTDED